jgi:hypothetical protein
MPSLTGVQLLPDGFQIDWTHGTATRLERGNIPGSVRNKTPAEVEQWINNWLDQQFQYTIDDPTDPDDGLTFQDVFVRVRVGSTNPLTIIDGWVSNEPLPADLSMIDGEAG